MHARFHGRVAVVTGAASGIGAATARRLAGDGARVLLVDLDAAAVKRCAHDLAGETIGFAADVSDEAAVAAYTNAALEAFGRIDLVFLNAGIPGPMRPIAELDAADFDRVVAVNLRGVFLGLRAALLELRTGGGSIVVTASTAGVSGSDLGAYSAAKHGVVGLVKSAAVEGAAQRVRVNGIAPGSVETAMTAALIDRLGGHDDDAIRSLWSTTPLGREQRRFGRAEEVASLVSFLLSDEAAWITGAIVPVDGGVLASDPYRLPGDVAMISAPPLER